MAEGSMYYDTERRTGEIYYDNLKHDFYVSIHKVASFVLIYSFWIAENEAFSTVVSNCSDSLY
jgi:hypothetical protein